MPSTGPQDHPAPARMQPAPWDARTEWPVLVLLIALAFAVRLFRLDSLDLKLDEALELFKARHIQDVLTQGMFLDTHAPFFPVITALWSALGLASNDWLVRLLPATLGVGAVPVLYFLTRNLFGRQPAWIAALLLAVSPFFVTLSRDLKDDIFLVFAGMLAVYFLLCAVTHNRPKYWIAYTLTAALACYSQFFMGPLLVMVNLWFLATLRAFPGRFRNWFVANCVAFVLVIPVLLFALYRSHVLFTQADKWWMPKPSPTLVMYYLKTLSFGYSDLSPYFKLALLAYGLAALTGFVLSWRSNAKGALLLSFWMPASVGLIILISLRGQSVFLYRSMALYGIPFYIWMAVAIARIRPVAVRTGTLVVLVSLAAISLSQLYQGHFPIMELPHRPGHTRPLPYRAAAEYIRARALPGDYVVHSANTTTYPLIYYGLDKLPHANVGVEPGPIENFAHLNPRVPVPPELENAWMTALQPLARDRNRIWFVFTEWERLYMGHNPMAVYRWLDAHYIEVLHKSFGEMEIFLFQRAQDGKAITVNARDRDDGVSALLEYAGGISTRYLKVRPDAGLVATPPEARRGNLTLYFNDNPSEPVDGERNADGAGVTFSIENRSERTVECKVQLVFSDYLLEFASLNEDKPASGTWAVGEMHNPGGLPPSYGIPVVVNHLTDDTLAVLTGEITLPPGVYDPQVLLLGAPGNRERSLLKFDVGGTDVLAPLRGVLGLPLAWTWFDAQRIKAPAAPMPVALYAKRPAGDAEARNDAAYAVFSRADERVSDRFGVLPPIPPGDVSLAPHSKRTWRYTGTGRRVDIWVYESGADGRAYRIFRRLDR